MTKLNTKLNELKLEGENITLNNVCDFKLEVIDTKYDFIDEEPTKEVEIEGLFNNLIECVEQKLLNESEVLIKSQTLHFFEIEELLISIEDNITNLDIEDYLDNIYLFIENWKEKCRKEDLRKLNKLFDTFEEKGEVSNVFFKYKFMSFVQDKNMVDLFNQYNGKLSIEVSYPNKENTNCTDNETFEEWEDKASEYFDIILIGKGSFGENIDLGIFSSYSPYKSDINVFENSLFTENNHLLIEELDNSNEKDLMIDVDTENQKIFDMFEKMNKNTNNSNVLVG